MKKQQSTEYYMRDRLLEYIIPALSNQNMQQGEDYFTNDLRDFVFQTALGEKLNDLELAEFENLLGQLSSDYAHNYSEELMNGVRSQPKVKRSQGRYGKNAVALYVNLMEREVNGQGGLAEKENVLPLDHDIIELCVRAHCPLSALQLTGSASLRYWEREMRKYVIDVILKADWKRYLEFFNQGDTLNADIIYNELKQRLNDQIGEIESDNLARQLNKQNYIGNSNNQKYLMWTEQSKSNKQSNQESSDGQKRKIVQQIEFNVKDHEKKQKTSKLPESPNNLINRERVNQGFPDPPSTPSALQLSPVGNTSNSLGELINQRSSYPTETQRDVQQGQKQQQLQKQIKCVENQQIQNQKDAKQVQNQQQLLDQQIQQPPQQSQQQLPLKSLQNPLQKLEVLLEKVNNHCNSTQKSQYQTSQWQEEQQNISDDINADSIQMDLDPPDQREILDSEILNNKQDQQQQQTGAGNINQETPEGDQFVQEVRPQGESQAIEGKQGDSPIVIKQEYEPRTEFQEASYRQFRKKSFSNSIRRDGSHQNQVKGLNKNITAHLQGGQSQQVTTNNKE